MPLVTVSEMVRFAVPTGSTVLAGAAGLGRPVTWARLLRARPATLGVVEPGEVWLLSAGALHQAGDPRAVARLIRDVAGAGVVAFVVGESLRPEALAVAERVGAPVVLRP